MADKIINLKINVSKIDATKLFKGQQGLYLDATLLYNDAQDQYGNNGMIVQQVSKEARLAGEKGAILGNAKVFATNSAPSESDIPSFLKSEPVAEAAPNPVVVDSLPF